MVGVQRPANWIFIYIKIQAVNTAQFTIFREEKTAFVHAVLLLGKGGLPVAVGVGPEVKPEAVQGVRGVVLVGNIDLSPEDVRLIVQADVNVVMHFLLKVGRLCPEVGQGGEYKKKREDKMQG